MFRSKYQHYSSIKCPFSNKCNLPHCLFGHSDNQLDNPITQPEIIAGDPERPAGQYSIRLSPSEKSSATETEQNNGSVIQAYVKRPIGSNLVEPSNPPREPKIQKREKRIERDSSTVTVMPVKPHAPALQSQRMQLAGALAELLKEKKLTKLPNKHACLKEYEIASSTSKVTYPNTMKQYIMSLRKGQQQFSLASNVTSTRTISTDVSPVNPSSLKANAIMDTSSKQKALTREQILAKLTILVHEPSTLESWGFMTCMPTDEEIKEAIKGSESGYEVCDRCTRHFKVEAKNQAQCIYHWGKSFKNKSTNIKKYSCCGESVTESMGCTEHYSHVFRVSHPPRLAALIPFATHKHAEQGEQPLAVSLDCEMAYTTLGTELIRVSILEFPSHRILYDTLVRPLGRVIDLNTRFSGVKNLDAGDIPLFGDVRKQILKRFIGPKTITVGHGLENDLFAMRILHTRIVDSALLYPHDNPFLVEKKVRQSLRFLAWEHLEQDIQKTGKSDTEIIGHDSFEDAKAAADLVLKRIEFLVRLEESRTK
ncbi:hypothetical protein V1511DRAFT_498054 [Dipodascopsis uninucleata]